MHCLIIPGVISQSIWFGCQFLLFKVSKLIVNTCSHSQKRANAYGSPIHSLAHLAREVFLHAYCVALNLNSHLTTSCSSYHNPQSVGFLWHIPSALSKSYFPGSATRVWFLPSCYFCGKLCSDENPHPEGQVLNSSFTSTASLLCDIRHMSLYVSIKWKCWWPLHAGDPVVMKRIAEKLIWIIGSLLQKKEYHNGQCILNKRFIPEKRISTEWLPSIKLSGEGTMLPRVGSRQDKDMCKKDMHLCSSGAVIYALSGA